MNYNRCGLLVGFLFVALSRALTPGLAADPELLQHADVSWWLDEPGNRQPIRSLDDWAHRRQSIFTEMQRVMGPLPQPQSPVPLDVQTVEETRLADDRLIRRKVAYHTDSMQRRVRAWLFLPEKLAAASTSKTDDRNQSDRRAAILCLHQTTRIGKDEPAGLGGNPNLHYALHLARRGYVTLAPDYPSFGEYPYDFPLTDGYISGTMKAVYDNVRAIDLLQSLPFVDGERIGCIGHSLGGHNTMFTAAFEPRIKVLVSNCGFTRFHKYYEGRLKGWTSARYMPLIDRDFGNDPDRVPFDFPEIVASFAPRPFLASAPVRDSNFEVSGVRDTIAAAKQIYRLHGAEQNLQENYPDSAHDFPEDARKVAYEFFDQHLRDAPASGR
ncbi:alpha/beta fold hydrolase [bacterium]|nr:alpha/beta fold hydrolase [bacterium]